jgi:hypothetical protein
MFLRDTSVSPLFIIRMILDSDVMPRLLFSFAVPVDLDVRVKGLLLASVFAIVSGVRTVVHNSFVFDVMKRSNFTSVTCRHSSHVT